MVRARLRQEATMKEALNVAREWTVGLRAGVVVDIVVARLRRAVDPL